MSLHRFPRLVGGLNSLVNSLVADESMLADLQDGILQHGLPEQRFGHDILDLEPSHINDVGGTTKTRGYFKIDTSNYAFNTSWNQTLGTKWTIRWEVNYFTLANFTDGNRIALLLKGTTHDPVRITLVGTTSGSTCKFRVTIKDNAGNQVVLDSVARTSAGWLAAYASGSARYIRIVRDGATCYLYIGEQLEDSDTLTALPHETATQIWLGADTTPANFANIANYSNLVVVNRILSGAECYWGIGWPTDAEAETDVLGNWAFCDMTGATIEDLSLNAKDLTVTSADWQNSNNVMARGLGMHTHRRNDGTRHHLVACMRRSTSSAGAKPSGALYAWKATTALQPFYFGGDAANDDATAILSGLNKFARMQFLSVGNDCLIANGKDYARNYGGISVPAIRYWGITAPATAPYVTYAGSGGAIAAGTYGYCYTYFSSLTGVESGRSPVIFVTAAASDVATVRGFGSLDPNVSHLRFYRTQVGSQKFTLCVQGEVANGTAPSLTDSSADADILGNTPLPGDDEARSATLKRLFLQGGPQTGMTVVIAAGGALTAGTHHYGYSWYSSATGEETGIWPATLSGGALLAPVTAAAGNLTANITGMVLPDKNSKYDQMRIYKTKAGARVWYLRETITAATTYSDAAGDSGLPTTGLEEYALPPKCRMAVLFSNRLIMSGDEDNPTKVYVSVAGDYQNIPWVGHDFIPNPGGEVTGLVVAGNLLLIQHRDGRITSVPKMGTESDLALFLLQAPEEYSPTGAAVSHHSIQKTPLGAMWLGRDGFYRAVQGGAQLVSPGLTPEFLSLNLVRARYACSVYLADEQLYLCWASRGNQRLNEQAFVADLSGPINGTGPMTWGIWNINADMAGVLTDANEAPHYCFLVENGVLCEFDPASAQDGDGSGTLSGAVAGASINHITDIVGRVAPTGGDGGYSIYLVKSDGTTLRRTQLDPALSVDAVNFYPSAVEILTGSWTVYYHGIRFTLTTMKTDCGNPRPDKTFQTAFVTHDQEAAGSVGVEYAADADAMASVGANPSATDQMTSEASIQKAGRYIQLRVTHQPPVAGETLKVVEVAVEYATGGDTQS